MVVLYLFYSLVIRDFLSVVLLSILLGSWLVSRPSEWLARGISNLGLHLGLSEYTIGILSSLTAISGEILIVSLSLYVAYITGHYELIIFAILVILYSISFNILTLGLIVSFRGGKKITVPDEILSKELEILDWAVVAIFLISFLWIARKFLFPVTSDIIYLPREVAFILPVCYVVYMVHIRKIKLTARTGLSSKPTLSITHSILLTLIGTIAVIIGGNLITDAAISLVMGGMKIFEQLGNPLIITALIVGAASAIYDATINLIFSARGQLLTSVGNLIGSALQLLLLVIGIVGIIIPIPLTEYVIFQLIAIGMSLYFFRQAIADRGLDPYEGAMIVLFQFFIFVVAVRGF